MSDRLTLALAIEDAGIEREKATRIASVIVELIRGSVATKADVQVSEVAIRGELAQTRAELKAAIAALRYLPPPHG